MRTEQGRPPKGSEPATTKPRSVRFPDATWSELELRAASRGVTLHALLRDIISGWLSRTA